MIRRQLDLPAPLCETGAVTAAILYPTFSHKAIEESYASWQTQMLLRGSDHERCVHFYDSQKPVSAAIAEVGCEHALVVTDPLLVPDPTLAARLEEILNASDGALAALPVSNGAENPAQQRTLPRPYLTLRELQTLAADLQRQPARTTRVQWDSSDPSVYLARTSALASIHEIARRALAGRDVVVSENDFVHRWASLRGQARRDLLERIPLDARSILEFGCGEAPLGTLLKERQPCRVVGIELDPRAAAVARKRIDDVYCGDAVEIVSIVQEQFDWIIGGDIIEHIDEPWTFLSNLRKLCRPGGHLLLSIPNLAHASIVSDLLHGRFDYVYMGLTCVGHLRFFTRRTIEEMLFISGWSVASFEPQAVSSAEAAALMDRLQAAGVGFSRDDLSATGYYVVAHRQ
jgi:2-polyprenyl-3-methyl-5-hydroxy-6-metoxy-1,4-benzoquinol methylase